MLLRRVCVSRPWPARWRSLRLFSTGDKGDEAETSCAVDYSSIRAGESASVPLKTPQTVASLRAAHDYCLQQVRDLDREAFLYGIFLPTRSRQLMYATRALDLEVAKSKERALKSQAAVGMMRLQWWRESINALYRGEPSQQPILIALADMLQHQQYTKRWFDRLILGRSLDMEEGQPSSVQDLEDYAEQTVSSVLYLTLESLGVRDLGADHAASHIGKAWGLVTLLRNMGHNCSKGKLYLPMELTSKHRVNVDEVMRGIPSDPLSDACLELATLARDHLLHARDLKSNVPRAAMRALLPSVLIDRSLADFEKFNFNVFDSRLSAQASGVGVQLQLTYKAMTASY